MHPSQSVGGVTLSCDSTMTSLLDLGPINLTWSSGDLKVCGIANLDFSLWDC